MNGIQRIAACAGAVLVVAAAGVGVYAGWLAATGNIHEVVAGELYRSATLSPRRLAALIEAEGIRTIISLRGGTASDSWRQEEAAIASAAGVTLINLRWSASREPTDADVAAFYAAAAESPKPILIHCRSGADRTGLASALYLARIKRTGEEEAEGQLSIRYGHFGTPLSRAYPMDQTFERLEASLGYPNS